MLPYVQSVQELIKDALVLCHAADGDKTSFENLTKTYAAGRERLEKSLTVLEEK